MNRGRTPSTLHRRYARTLLDRGQWRFPILNGIVGAPTLDREGRILQTRGYDRESGLYLDLSDSFPEVPEHPTKEDARIALECLAYPLRGFPFASETDRSVALAMMLTSVIRRSLQTAPMFLIDAPTPGTGKSKLAEISGILACGQKPAAISQGKSAEEDEKRLATLLFAGDAIILLDNVERPIQGDFLCSILTQEVVQARILGQTERRVLPSLAVVIATGNNLEVYGDMCRRVVVCRLDAGMENPESRQFDFDACEEVRANRAELVVDALTILRAYHLAGCPDRLPSFGSFEDWAWVRGALVWLGFSDPHDSRGMIVSNDPVKEALVAIMDGWEETIGLDTPTRVKEMAATPKLKNKPGGSWIAKVPKCDKDGHAVSPLHEAFKEHVCNGSWDAMAVGKWLAKHKDRVIGGRCFRVVSRSNSHGAKWALVRMT